MSTITRHEITNVEIAYHRNGVAGEGFYVVTFDWLNPEGTRRMVATVFPPDPITSGPFEGEPDWLATEGFHNPRVAVLDMDMLPNIKFTENSWRGDTFADALYHAILESRH